MLSTDFYVYNVGIGKYVPVQRFCIRKCKNSESSLGLLSNTGKIKGLNIEKKDEESVCFKYRGNDTIIRWNKCY